LELPERVSEVAASARLGVVDERLLGAPSDAARDGDAEQTNDDERGDHEAFP
jgi:hypothetical protein